MKTRKYLSTQKPEKLVVDSVCVCAQSLNHVRFFCDPMDCRLPGSSVKRICQARILEWVAISS